MVKEETLTILMTARARLLVMALTAPVVVFAIVGGFLGKAIARDDTYLNLKVFDDVTTLITNNYVEPVDVDRVMHGALHGLADALDPDSAYLSAPDVRQIETGTPLPEGDVGLELTRQYYLRVIAARDGSPAARAGLRTGDYVRVIDDTPTREMSVWEGSRVLRGAPGTTVKLTIIRGNAADPHIVTLIREAVGGSEVTGRMATPGIGYVRVAGFSKSTAERVAKEVASLTKLGASKLVVDVRRTASGELNAGLAAARVFVGSGTLAIRESKSGVRETVAAGAGDGGVTLPVVVLVDGGTAGAAELFASALAGNKRADLIGEHTIGRAAVQRLIKLPDGSGLWLSTLRYLTPLGTPLHDKGLEPTIAIEEPDVEFGQPEPATDAALDKALEHLAAKSAA